MKKCVFLGLPFVILLLGMFINSSASAQAANSKPIYHVFLLEGKVLGYSEDRIEEEVGYEGTKAYEIRSRTFLKALLLGKVKDVDIKAVLYASSETFGPLYYKVDILSGADKLSTECKFDEIKAHLAVYRDDTLQLQKDIDMEANTYLVDSNIFGHLILVHKAIKLQKKDTVKKVNILVPSAMEICHLTLAHKGWGKIRADKRDCDCYILETEVEEIPGKTTAWVDKRTHQVIKAVIPSQKVNIELINEEVVKKVRGAEVLGELFCPSNVVFDSPRTLRYLKAKIKVQVLGERVNRDLLDNKRTQKFNGKIDDELIDGVIEVLPIKYRGANSPSFPMEGIESEKFREYLSPELNIECDDPAISQKAEEITQSAGNVWETVVRIARWVYENIRYEITGTPSAKLTLGKRAGDCGPHTNLAIALCRAVGIPARMVGGLCYGPGFGGSFAQHYWVEVYMGEDGWIHVEPTMCEYERIDAGHITLWHKGACRPLSIEVIDYRPKNRPVKVAKIDKPKKLRWKVGEQRTYVFKIGGVKMAEDVSKLLAGKAGKGYILESEVFLDFTKLGKPQKIRMKGTLRLSSEGAPLHHRLNALVDSQKQSVECEYGKDKVHAVVNIGGYKVERDATVSPGVFQMDNNFIGQAALWMDQLVLKGGKKISVNIFVPQILKQVAVDVKVKRMETIKVGGKEYKCFVCDIPQIHETFWVSEKGKLVKIEDPRQKLVIELKK